MLSGMVRTCLRDLVVVQCLPAGVSDWSTSSWALSNTPLQRYLLRLSIAWQFQFRYLFCAVGDSCKNERLSHSKAEEARRRKIFRLMAIRRKIEYRSLTIPAFLLGLVFSPMVISRLLGSVCFIH